MDTAIMLPVVKQQPAFNGFPFNIIELNGQPMFVASEVGQILGYRGDGRALQRQIRTMWDDRLDEGIDYVILKGEALGDVSLQLGKTHRQNTSKIRHLLLLSEEGLYAVLGMTDKPMGKAFRRHLSQSVLPALRQGLPTAPPREVTQEPLLQLIAQQNAILDRLTAAIKGAGIHVPPPSALPAVGTDARETFARFVAWCRGAGRPRLHIAGEPTPPKDCLGVLDGADVHFGAEALTTALGMNATALARSWVDAGLLDLPAGYDGRLNSAKWAKYVPALGTRKMFRARLDAASRAG